MTRKLKWTDVQEIALGLARSHPDADPLAIRFRDLTRWVRELPGFEDDPERSSEKILEAIQMAWLDEVSE